MAQLTLARRARRDDPNGHMVVQDNLDRVVDNLNNSTAKQQSGSTNLILGNTSVVVAHTLGATGYAAVVTPQSDPVGRFWVSNKIANGFTINISAALGANLAFDWIVRLP